MVCKNCGNEYDDILNYCPYCDTENSDKIIAEEYAKVNRLKQLSDWIRRSPNEVGHAAARPIVKVLVLLAMVAVIGTAIAFVVSAGVAFVRSTTAEETRNKRLSRLEELYDAGEYEKLEKQLHKYDDYYKHAYKKYNIAVSITGSELKWRSECMPSDYDFSQKIYISPKQIATNLCYVYHILDIVDVSERDGYIYDESVCCIYARDTITNAMKEYYFLSDEEISEGLKLYQSCEGLRLEEKAKQLEEFAGRVIDRWPWMVRR